MDARILERIDRNVGNIIKNQMKSDAKMDTHEEKEWGLFIEMEKRIRENEISLALLRKYNDSHTVKHGIIYALIALLFALTAALWMLR